MVRNVSSAAELRDLGIDVAVGDFERPESLLPAMTGVESVLLLTPLDASMPRWHTSIISAAKKAGVRRIVTFSGIFAALDSPVELGRLHAQSERIVEGSGMEWTHLRPNSLMQNLLVMRAVIRQSGMFYLPVGDGRVSVVDIRDIVSVAACVLTEDGHSGKAYTITGPEALTHTEMARGLSRGLGRRVVFADIPFDAWRQGMVAAGMSDWAARALGELCGLQKAGLGAEVTDAVAMVTQRPPIAFDQFVRDHAGLFER